MSEYHPTSLVVERKWRAFPSVPGYTPFPQHTWDNVECFMHINNEIWKMDNFYWGTFPLNLAHPFLLKSSITVQAYHGLSWKLKTVIRPRIDPVGFLLWYLIFCVNWAQNRYISDFKPITSTGFEKRACTHVGTLVVAVSRVPWKLKTLTNNSVAKQLFFCGNSMMCSTRYG